MHPKALILFTLFFFAPALCHGHKLSVFAWVEQGTIKGEAYFHGGKRARHVSIIIQTEDQLPPLATTQTDDTGNFSAPLPDHIRNKPNDLLVIADSGDGHRNEWLIERSEFQENLKIQQAAEPQQHVGQEVPPNAQHGTTQRVMAEKRVDEISAKDILAGLCIIFGLAGLALYLKRKRNKP